MVFPPNCSLCLFLILDTKAVALRGWPSAGTLELDPPAPCTCCCRQIGSERFWFGYMENGRLLGLAHPLRHGVAAGIDDHSVYDCRRGIGHIETGLTHSPASGVASFLCRGHPGDCCSIRQLLNNGSLDRCAVRLVRDPTRRIFPGNRQKNLRSPATPNLCHGELRHWDRGG
jgi:hypothetical protein